MKKKTHEEYEQELFKREIDYWPLERYVTNNTKILHECVEDHQWPVAPNSILAGSGCPLCASNRVRTHEEYIDTLLHKNILYKPIELYKKASVNILHECPKKHQWLVSPSTILKGHGCPICFSNQKKTTESYILDLEAKNISYRPVERYINSRTKILHECPVEGHLQWSVTPNSILKGSGCPTCSKHGFDPSKAAKLYFFSFEYDEIVYYKAGITNNSAQKRHSTDWGLLKIKLLWEIEYESGANAREAEKKILQDNKEFLINTGALLSGNTETFTVYIKPPKLADVV